MSELKATTVYDAYWTANSVGEGTGIQVYLKSEADKVIEEKDVVIAELIEKNERLASKDKIMASETIKDLFKELRHNKYKRCFAMATFCHVSSVLCEGPDSLFYRRWFHKWYELAERFKEE